MLQLSFKKRNKKSDYWETGRCSVAQCQEAMKISVLKLAFQSLMTLLQRMSQAVFPLVNALCLFWIEVIDNKIRKNNKKV